MSRDEAILVDLLSAARSAQDFLGGIGQAQFLSDRKTQSAVLHQLLLGEATKRLSTEYREQHQEVPWREIAGLRDRLIHAYDRVDLEMVWLVVQRRVPTLIEFLEQQVPPSLWPKMR